MKIFDTGFPLLDKIFAILVMVNIAGIFTLVIWASLIENIGGRIPNTYAIIARFGLFAVILLAVYYKFFVRRCKICKKKINMKYVLAITPSRDVYVCKECFNAPDVWEKYFKLTDVQKKKI